MAPFVFCGGAAALFSDLALAHLIQCFAVDAQRGGRAGLEPLQADLDAAGVTITVFLGDDAADRFVDLLDQLALPVTIAQFQRHVRFLAGTVIGVGKNGRFVLHRMHGAVDVLGQLAFHFFEHLAEMRQLPRIHVFLFALGFVGGVILENFGGHEGFVCLKKEL